MHFSLSVGSALTVAAALLCATPAVAQPHHHARHQHRRRQEPAAEKRGLAYNSGALAGKYSSTKAWSWAYNWGSLPGDDLGPGIEYVPMLHGPFSHYTTNFQLNIPKCLEKGSKYVLGFNEPDWPTPDGLNPYVDPATAAQNFRDMITPHSEQLSIGAPAVTSSVLEGKGVKWLRPFLEACKDCKIDFVPIHWYGEPGQGDAFLPHVDEVRELTRELLGEEVPLWITEFQLKGNDQQQADFLNLVLPELEKRDFVARYSYFFVDQSLAGGPTADPGKAYVA